MKHGKGIDIFNPVYENEDKKNPYFNVVKCISLFLEIQKRYELVCKSHGSGNNIFNPIYEGEDKITPV